MLSVSPALMVSSAVVTPAALLLPAMVKPAPAELAALATANNWSSVAARPLVIGVVAGSQVMLVKPVTVPAVPSIFTGLPPVAASPMVTVFASLKPI